jgi:hypothetical protein
MIWLIILWEMERKMGQLAQKVKWMICLSQELFYLKIIKTRKKILVLLLNYMNLVLDYNSN